MPRHASPARLLRTTLAVVAAAAVGLGGGAALALASGRGAEQASAASTPVTSTAEAGHGTGVHRAAREARAGIGDRARPRRHDRLPARLSRCDPAAAACVDLAARVSWLQQGGHVTYGPVRVLPGVGRFATPAGVFHVQWKDRHHTSNEYAEAMPYSVFFAPGGIAFHQGSLTTMSHGCVHLSAASAAAYYARLPVGAEVDVF